MALTFNLKICFVMIIIFIVLIKFFKTLRDVLILRRIPSPKSRSLLGVTMEFLKLSPEGVFEKLRAYAKQYKGIYRMTFLTVNIINIYNPEDVEQVISGYKHHTKSKTYGFLQSWLGTGLLTSTGSKWYHRRKLLTPAFHFQILQDYLTSFNEGTRKFVEEIEKNHGKCEDLKPLILNFTMNSICDTAMGLEKNERDSLEIYRKNVEIFGSIVVKRIITPWYRIDFLFNFFDLAKKEKKTVGVLHNFSKSVIKNREKNSRKILEKRKKTNMLDILLECKKKGADIDYEGIREEVDTFMFEGHDTVSSAINALLLLLANHPEVQKKVTDEIDQIFQKKPQNCTMDHLSKLQYTECCIKETLRLFPSVPFISRRCGEKYITKTGYEVPEGTVLHVHIYDLHRNPEIFPDPEKFIPERFLNDSVKRHPYSYIPFSAGPRNCIGQKFAMWEIKTLIVGLLTKYKMEAITRMEDVKFMSDLVLTMKNPIKIKFLRR